MSNAIWIDLLILAVFVITVAVYTVRGFAKSVIGFVVMVASLLAASLLGPYLAEMFYDGFMLDVVGKAVCEAITSLYDGVVGSIDGEAIIASLPEAIKNMLSFAGADLEELSAQLMTSSGIDNAAETVAGPIAHFISELVAYILVFVLAFIVFKLVSKLVVRIFELPVLRTLNKLAGFLLGLLVGFLICWGIALALRLVFGMLALDDPVFLELADPSGTYLYSFFTSIGA